ncbi:MAG: hypothetical protein CMI23_09445 [Opitutae bacterium]|jgi:hypothetical protein|nr:hypothetical protein [Opitutae bacterium]|tara:strand:+ start:801 stop:1454 length:654 start_codon:yes stop_codon:yes gene_type:complete
MTYDELKTDIANYLNRTDLTNQLDGFIKKAEAEVNRKIKHKDQIKRSQATLDAQYTQLPGDFVGIINVDLQDTNPPVALFQQSLESLDLHRSTTGDAKGQPKYFAVDGDTLEVSPTPDKSMTIQLTYYAEVPPLSSTNTENFLLRSNPDIYLYGALKHASIYLMEDERVGLFSGLFEKALEELRIQQQNASFGKGSLLKRRRTYGNNNQPTYYYSKN